jgi:hypothetical protein
MTDDIIRSAAAVTLCAMKTHAPRHQAGKAVIEIAETHGLEAKPLAPKIAASATICAVRPLLPHANARMYPPSIAVKAII